MEQWGNSTIVRWRNGAMAQWGNSAMEQWGNSAMERWAWCDGAGERAVERVSLESESLILITVALKWL